MNIRFAAALAALILAAVPATAQAPRGGLADPEAHIVGELVVVAKERGPAWWRVKDADTTVYILGIPGGALPPGTEWDRTVLQKRLAGAHTVVMGTQLKAGLGDIPAILRAVKKLKSKAPMEEGLAPPLRARFVAARERLGKPASRYAGWQPVVAGQFLMQDAYGGKGWTSAEEVVRNLARRAHAPIRTTSKYDLVPFLNTAIAGLTPVVQTECLEGALDDLDAGRGRVERAAAGWARGDVPVALTAPRSFDRCLLALSGGAELWKNATRDNANDIATALKTPGHAVAIINLRRLLADDGVIEQLEARGLHVIGPGEAG